MGGQMSLPDVDRDIDGECMRIFNQAGYISHKSRVHRLYKKLYALSYRKKINLLKRLKVIKAFNAV